MRKAPISMSATCPPDGRLGSCLVAIGIDGEQPPIAVGADVNGSGPNGHAEFYSICSTLALAHICGEGPE